MERLFDGVSPMVMVKERSSKDGEDINDIQAMGLQGCTTLQVQTHMEFVDQWKPEYVSQAFPTVLTRRVGGPEFFVRPEELCPPLACGKLAAKLSDAGQRITFPGMTW